VEIFGDFVLAKWLKNRDLLFATEYSFFQKIRKMAKIRQENK
jgi:hypothetical protein